MTALLALEDPQRVPAAAVARLRVLGVEFAEPFAWTHADLMATLARVSVAASTALAAALDGADAVALDNAGRLAAACERLFGEAAVRASGRERAAAMRAAKLCRALYANTVLVVAEHAQSARLATPSGVASIRLLPGAAAALDALAADPLVMGAGWDLDALSARLARWVVA